MNTCTAPLATVPTGVSGEFVTRNGERYYVIRNVDELQPFLVTVVSSDDHWLFASSTGGLTAGRVSPESALFPYITVDKIHESMPHTGSATLIRLGEAAGGGLWAPFDAYGTGRSAVTRKLFKSLLGSKLCYEEIHHDSQLAFRYTWAFSAPYGFIRQCELENLGPRPVRTEILDGLQNILPAGTPSHAQTQSSNLVNAYKWNELDAATGLATYSLYSRISDRAEPCESLHANTAFCLGLDARVTLLSSSQLQAFRHGESPREEHHVRGVRGAYLVNAAIDLAPGETRAWQMVLDCHRTQAQVVALSHQLQNPGELAGHLARSIDQGEEELARLMGAADGFQATGEETVSAHHYANVLFNVLRGGTPGDQYLAPARDFALSVQHFNRPCHARHRDWFKALPESLQVIELRTRAADTGDAQLERLALDYLPITFGRRHGDPSRPWNRFSIHLRDREGRRLLSYEGNWRDIFQNWEALAYSYPELTEHMIAKFVNASTIDGYNPYRINKQGIDWEIEEPDDPWSNIGYWGDHQIIYLLKLLEVSASFNPRRLKHLLRHTVFSYANVPYRIKPHEALMQDPKHTVQYDYELSERIEQRVAVLGADGKLVLNADGQVYLVNLIEKLLVPLLAKLGNLVVDGGIWLNTQRPEWNDANNALVGHGLSMVTMYYMRRYVRHLQAMLAPETEDVELSAPVGAWIDATAAALRDIREGLGRGPVDPAFRLRSLDALGLAASRYRQEIYAAEFLGAKVEQPIDGIRALLDDALAAIDHSIGTNQRDDGLFHAYNLMEPDRDGLAVQRLYAMLEGQVAVLSAGILGAEDACALLEALFASPIYRADQDSFMLYPDRPLPSFLDKNRVPRQGVEAIPVLERMLSRGDERLIVCDISGQYRFAADLINARALDARLDELSSAYGTDLEAAREALHALYEEVFNHRSFTGRSGTMFGFEGLGCIYWHMVAKLLLAVQETYFMALDTNPDEEACRRLGELYYRVRKGLGFNKTPAAYGAFPTDPYSHTPRHAGARQPGMTGQVKEEILTRFGELGIRVQGGQVRFNPTLLRRREFSDQPQPFRYVDVRGEWQQLEVPAPGLAFTWCQVPIVYHLVDRASEGLTVTSADGSTRVFPDAVLAPEVCQRLFGRSGEIQLLTLGLAADRLF